MEPVRNSSSYSDNLNFRENVAKIFKQDPILLKTPRDFHNSLPDITVEIQDGVILRHTPRQVHAYDPTSGSSALIKLFRETITVLHVQKDPSILCLHGSNNVYEIDLTKKGFQPLKPKDNAPKVCSFASSAKIKLVDVKPILFDGRESVMLECMLDSLQNGKSTDVMDLFKIVTNAITPSERAIVKTFKMSGKTLATLINGDIEIFNYQTGQPEKVIKLGNSTGNIIDAALFSQFLAVARENSNKIEIVDINTEELLHTLTAKNHVKELFFSEDLLAALLRDTSIQLWAPNAKAPTEPRILTLSRLPQTPPRNPAQKGPKPISEQEQLDIKNDNEWLNNFSKKSYDIGQEFKSKKNEFLAISLH